MGNGQIDMEKAIYAPVTAWPARTTAMAMIATKRYAGRRRGRTELVSTLVLLCLSAVCGCNTTPSFPSGMTPSPTVITLPPTERLTGLTYPALALSPDGTQVVTVVLANGLQQLHLRSVTQSDSTPIPGTDGAIHPLFSPDGQWIAFFADGKLKKVSLADGTVLTLCDALRPRGASWRSDDTIVFTPTLNSSLWQVPASGGTPQVLTSLQEERSHRWPYILPGGKVVLFGIPAGSSWDEAQIVAQQLETGERRVLVQGGTNPRYVPTGHLLFARDGNLMAVPFDPEQLQVNGAPVAVVEGVMETPRSGAAQFSVSRNGVLVYIPGRGGEPERRLVWVDREGSAEPLAAPPRPYEHPRLSPDGQRVAVAIVEPAANIFVYDIQGETLTQLTSEASNTFPIWTPDGKRVTFRSTLTGPWNVFWKAADGSGEAEQLTVSDHINEPSSWSPDGQALAFTEFHPTTNRDLWILPLEGERKPRPILQTPFDEGAASVSPDGRWVAYASNDSVRYEIYVQPFPGPGGPASADSGPQGERWQISSEGGAEPIWSPNGRELFYRNEEKMMAVEVKTQPSFSAAPPRLVFEGRYEPALAFRPNYDVSADGQRFLMLQAIEQPPQLNVVQNWFEELKRRVPTGN